jgi:hypothetical protein
MRSPGRLLALFEALADRHGPRLWASKLPQMHSELEQTAARSDILAPWLIGASVLKILGLFPRERMGDGRRI